MPRSTTPSGVDRIEDAYPLVSSQASMLSECLASDDPSLYVEQTILRFTGPLDQERFHKAWSRVTQALPPLRTVFAWRGAQPMQVVLRSVEDNWTVKDLSGLTAERQDDEIRRHVITDRLAGFDLRKGPLSRYALFTLGPDTHVFVWTHHHLILDGWSVGLLVSLVERAYAEGTAPDPQGAAHHKFVEWLAGRNDKESRNFWATHLEGYVPSPLPGIETVPQKTPADEDTDAWVQHSIPDNILGRWECRLAAGRITLSTLITAAWAVTVQRHAGSEETVVGLTSASRPREIPESLRHVGVYVDVAPLRLAPPEGMTVREWLPHVQQLSRRVMSHNFSGEQVPPHMKSVDLPLLQNAVVLQNSLQNKQAWTRFADLQINDVDFFVRTGVPIMLMAFIHNGLQMRCIFDPHRVEAETARDFLDHFVVVLQAMADTPDTPVNELPILTDAERALVDGINITGVPAGKPGVHHRFAELAQEDPAHLALTGPGGDLTYGEVEERTRRLASRLIDAGAGSEKIVAIIIGRSSELVEAMLATHRSGAAFCVVNPDGPSLRWDVLREDLDPAVVLVRRDEAPEQLINDPDVMIFEDAVSEPPKQVELPTTTAPEQLAYVVFTSGSTGKPKGVMVTHGGLDNVVGSEIERMELDRSARMLQFCATTFDVFILEVFATFGAGATLVVGRDEDVAPTERMAPFMSQFGVTHAIYTPSALAALPEPLDVPTLRTLSTIGEPLSVDLVERYAGKYHVFNLYGPAEASIVTLGHHCVLENGDPPIGAPIRNTTVHILGPGRAEIPFSTPGELFLEGICLARGYLKQPEVTARAFPETHRGRLYATGDLVTRCRDGLVLFKGRTDDQVKIRGFRIEPAEIEHVLLGHVDVTSAVVVGRGTGAERGLSAYVVLDPQKSECSEDSARRVESWRQLYESTYGAAGLEGDGVRRFVGWRDSFANQRIPAEQMNRWGAETVERILFSKPGTVLDVGCGTGIVLLPLAEAGVDVTGLDMSERALNEVRRNILQLPPGSGHIKLQQCAADAIGSLEGTFDIVVLNSVIQYFPSASYLSHVLDLAWSKLRSGGQLFIGDIRALQLLPEFHLARLKEQNCEDESIITAEQVLAAVRDDEELVLDPGFFASWAADKVDAIVSPVVKNLPDSNEMSLFRYDVRILKHETDVPPARLPEPHVTYDLDAFWAALSDSAEAVVLEGIRDARTAELVDDWCTRDLTMPTVAGIPVHVADIDERLTSLGYDLDAVPGPLAGSLRILASRKLRAAARLGLAARLADNRNQEKTVNSPLERRRETRVIEELHQLVEQAFPAHMRPDSITVLDEIPRNSNDKVNKSQLPAPIPFERHEKNVDAADAVEFTAARIFGEVLHLPPLPVNLNFFHTGGNSLLGLSLCSKLSENFDVDIEVRSLLEHPTPRGMAGMVRDLLACESRRPDPVVLLKNGTSQPVFLVHAAAGNAMAYLPLVQVLPSDTKIYGLEEPNVDVPTTSMRDLAAYYVERIREIQPSGPYVVGGWSFGGLVASLMADQLTREEQQARLILVDAPVPRSDVTGGLNRARFTAYLSHRLGPIVTEVGNAVGDKGTDDDFVERVISVANLEDVGAGIVQKLWESYRRSLQLMSTFEPPSFGGESILYRAEDQSLGTTEQIDTSIDLGWGLYLPGLQVVPIEGDHVSIMLEPRVAQLASDLAQRLADWDAA